MKKIAFTLIALSVTLLCSAEAMATAFTVDNLRYTILSEQPKTVSVSYVSDQGGVIQNGVDWDDLLSDKYVQSNHSNTLSATTEIVIPSSVTYNNQTYSVVKIADYGFQKSPITSISIPSSIKNIGISAFASCSSEFVIYCYSETAPNTVENAFDNSNVKAIYVPKNSLTNYHNESPWKNYFISEMDNGGDVPGEPIDDPNLPIDDPQSNNDVDAQSLNAMLMSVKNRLGAIDDKLGIQSSDFGAQVQTKSNYDVDGNGEVSIADVTSAVNRILGKTDVERVTVDGENLYDLLKRLDERLKAVEEKMGNQSTQPSPSVDSYNGHEYVDLGLPSGIKWATMNVGATTPERYGDYFAWGETEPYYITNYSMDKDGGKWKADKSSGYDWPSYKWCSNGSWTGMTKYTFPDEQYEGIWYNPGFVGDKKTVLEPADDAACVNWGGNWRMPTYEEILELRDNCTWTWETLNDVYGYKVSSKTNSNSIFLPASGWHIENWEFAGDTDYCNLWSSSLYMNLSDLAVVLSFNSGNLDWSFLNRCNGLPVRAVCP